MDKMKLIEAVGEVGLPLSVNEYSCLYKAGTGSLEYDIIVLRRLAVRLCLEVE